MGKTKKYPPHPVIDCIRKIMNDRNLKKSTLAMYAGIDPSQMTKVMNGTVQINLWQLSNLASGLGMELIDLFTYPEKFRPVNESKDEMTASITIQLKDEKKEQALKLLFGDKNLKLLT